MKYYLVLLGIAALLNGGEEGLKKLSAETTQRILELQQFQKEYDEAFWFNRDFEKFRHVLLHLVDNVGKLAKYCESKEHGKEPDPSLLINEVLPDLLMHTLQFANAFEVDLAEKYENRINGNIKKRRPMLSIDAAP